MDLREMLKRRLKKTSENKSPSTGSSRPDPPAVQSTTRIGDMDDDDNAKHNGSRQAASLSETKPRIQGIQQPRRPKQPIELGTIQYCNITSDGRHGDYDTVLQIASQNLEKPIFANFVEWTG
jgi:hypothetical protein